jgi:2-polyprenyl-3-methyl-5-hydroxy-6-metoxy-1,4-benzoquinol methylase
MRFGPLPETAGEVVGLLAGLVPRPVIDSLVALGLARTIMAATRLDLFEALEGGPLDESTLAARLGTDARATGKLLVALEASGYVVRRRGDRWGLTPVARRYMLAGSPDSLRDFMLLNYEAWRWVEHYERYVRTGEPLDVHRGLDADGWRLYQRGMRSLATLVAPEVARRTPVPRGARSMLDVGGSHGFLSVTLCRRHPGLRSVVLDLPEAIVHAAPILAAEGLGDRVVHREGDARTADLGRERHDLVLISALVHHFDDAQNRDLVRRAARALRPGGVLVIQELVQGEAARAGGQAGALGDLYFAALSASGTFRFEEMAGWQVDAGLVPLSPIRFRRFPGIAQQAARKI